MDAVILAGGLGTRLAATVPHLPKALAPIQGVPFLQLLFEQLAKSQIISKVVLALGYKADAIEHFLSTQSHPFQIALSIESSPLGTGGAVLHALNQTKTDTLLVLNGDSYFDLSLASFLAFHQMKQAPASIASREMEDVSRYGAIEMDAQQRVISFFEKSPLLKRGWINGGLYLIQRDLLSPFPPASYSLENDFLPEFVKKGLFAYPDAGTFIDIGTQSSYFEAQHLLGNYL